jgi:hypothetical protein
VPTSPCRTDRPRLAVARSTPRAWAPRARPVAWMRARGRSCGTCLSRGTRARCARSACWLLPEPQRLSPEPEPRARCAGSVVQGEARLVRELLAAGRGEPEGCRRSRARRHGVARQPCSPWFAGRTRRVVGIGLGRGQGCGARGDGAPHLAAGAGTTPSSVARTVTSPCMPRSSLLRRAECRARPSRPGCGSHASAVERDRATSGPARRDHAAHARRP